MNASRLLVLIAMCLAAAFSFGAGPASPAAAAAITVDGATVYDENNNGQADTDGDTWAYTDDGGAAYLLVRYRIEDNRRVAYLYDDVTGDGKIDFTPSGEGLTITEPQWRLKLTVREPGADWWIPGRLPNVNLDVDVASAYVFQGGAANMMMINAPEPRNKASGGLLNGAPWVKVQLYDSQKAGVLDIRRDNANIEAYGFDTIVVNKSPRPAQIGDERLPLLNAKAHSTAFP
ncbi:MAG: hypothetical protein NTZ05_21700 [Chloroflexi bacterium]|nr:hypothetical protein [Chloroflexota bacterium]